MKSSNDIESTPQEIDNTTLMKSKSPQGGTDIQSHVQLAARMNNSQQKIGDQKKDTTESQLKNEVTHVVSQEGDLQSSQKESLLNILNQSKRQVEVSSKQDDSVKQSGRAAASNINEPSNDGHVGGKHSARKVSGSPDRRSQIRQPLMVQIFQIPDQLQEKTVAAKKPYHRTQQSMNRTPQVIMSHHGVRTNQTSNTHGTKVTNAENIRTIRMSETGNNYFEHGDQQSIGKTIKEVCVSKNQRKPVVDDLYPRMQESITTYKKPIEVPVAQQRKSQHQLDHDNYTQQGTNSRLQKMTSLQEQIISAETKIVNRPIEDGVQIIASPKSVKSIKQKGGGQYQEFIQNSSNPDEQSLILSHKETSNRSQRNKGQQIAHLPPRILDTRVPRILQIEQKYSYSPTRQQVEQSVDERDHSQYTKYPAAAERHHFQNLGQAFNNRAVMQIKAIQHTRKLSQPVHTKTFADHAMENYQNAMTDRQQRERTEQETFNFFKSSLLGKAASKKSDKAPLPLKMKKDNKLPKISDAVTPIVDKKSELPQKASNVQLEGVMQEIDQQLFIDPITNTESGPISQQALNPEQQDGVIFDKNGAVSQHVQIIQRNSEITNATQNVETVYQRKQQNLHNNLSKHFGQTGPQAFKSKVSKVSNQRSGVHTSDNVAKGHRRNYSNIVHYNYPESSVSGGLYNIRPTRQTTNAQSMMIEARMNQTGGSMEHTQDTMTSMARNADGWQQTQNLSTSNTWNGKKFSFLKALNKQEVKKGSEALDERKKRQFMPYYSERDELGNLLKNPLIQQEGMTSQGYEAKGSKSQSKAIGSKLKVEAEENIPDTASKCSTDSKKERFLKKKLAELEDFNLNKGLRKALDGKRNDPARQTTFKNLDQIKRNARLKIIKQMKFSNQTDLKFENPDQRDLPDILNNRGFASQLEAMDNQSIPEETFREHDSYAKTVKSTARQQYEPLGSTKYCTAGSVTDQESQLPEGVQQLRIPNHYYGSESLYGSSVQQNINDAKKVNYSSVFQTPTLHTERQTQRIKTQGDEMASLGFELKASNVARNIDTMQKASKIPTPSGASNTQQLFPGNARRVSVTQSKTGTPSNIAKRAQEESPPDATSGGVTTKTAFFAPPIDYKEKIKQIEKQINLRNSQNQYFKLKLPHSRAYLTNMDLAKYNEVTRPQQYHRQYLSDYMQSDKNNDLIKQANKEKLKQQIRYTCPQGIEFEEMQSLIPEEQIQGHLLKDEDFPTMPDAKPAFHTNQQQTFAQSERFHDHKFYYSGYSMQLSALDFNNYYKGSNPIRSFDRQFIRDDLFLSKDQVAVIEAKKAVSKEKDIRMQKLKEEQEQKDKDLEKQMGGNGQQGVNNDLLEKGQQIRFQYSDHARVMEMRPYINLMKDTIIVQAKERELKGIHF